MRGHDEAQRTPYTGTRHSLQRIDKEWMPVAHADVDREAISGSVEPVPKPFCLRLCKLGEGGAAADDLVVMRDFLHTSWRYAPAT